MSSQVSIVLVDDSTLMRRLLKNIIEASDEFLVVGEASHGKEGLDIVKKLQPNVILLDIEMPEMDGIEFLKRARLIAKGKVIIVSSVALLGSSVARECRTLGAVDVIEKPSGSLSLDMEEKAGKRILESIARAAGTASDASE